MKDLPKEAVDLLLSLIPAEPAKALQRILPEMSFADVAPVVQPTAAQLQKLRGLEPYTEMSLVEIKKRLSAGSITFGPQHRTILRGTIVPQLVSVGLNASIRQATREELKQARLVEDHEPEYFRDPQEPRNTPDDNST